MPRFEDASHDCQTESTPCKFVQIDFHHHRARALEQDVVAPGKHLGPRFLRGCAASARAPWDLFGIRNFCPKTSHDATFARSAVTSSSSIGF